MSLFEHFHDQIVEELSLMTSAQPGFKDILIVVHDQLPFVRECIESVFSYTQDYTLYIWDNGSQDDSLGYLLDLARQNLIILLRSPDNLGFIIPNNGLYKIGSNPYVIVLNSDTVVRPNWTEAMVGYLQGHPEVGAVGYEGSKLNAQGEGGQPGIGRDIDYVCGWCACYPRAVLVESGGLFDEVHLKFAYAEDSDLCLRLQEKQWAVHALHLDLVFHHGNKTIGVVHNELGGPVVRETFQKNHAYIRQRWAHVLPS